MQTVSFGCSDSKSTCLYVQNNNKHVLSLAGLRAGGRAGVAGAASRRARLAGVGWPGCASERKGAAPRAAPCIQSRAAQEPARRAEGGKATGGGGARRDSGRAAPTRGDLRRGWFQRGWFQNTCCCKSCLCYNSAVCHVVLNKI